MMRKAILCALASATIISGAALAQGRGGGGGGGPPPSVGGGMGNAGGIGRNGSFGGFGGINDIGSTMRDQGRLNSQGPNHASQSGIDHANANSVLAGTSSTRTVTRGSLTGLTTGMTLMSNGTAVGTVQQIRTTGTGSVALVIVKGTNGGLYAVPASKLTLSGGVLSTTARFNGINTSTNVAMSSQARLNSQGPVHASATGIAHANSHSVLAGAAGGTALTGVSVGMPLLSNGTQVGTVYRVVTANGTITRVLVQGTNGRIYSLAPATLTASGGSLTTTATLRGI
jgi:sporulation protein YlmC with PRC-barrel domain